MSIEEVKTSNKFSKHTISVDDAEDTLLFALAMDRMKRYDPSKVRSFSDIKEKYGISDDELDGDDVVIE